MKLTQIKHHLFYLTTSTCARSQLRPMNPRRIAIRLCS